MAPGKIRSSCGFIESFLPPRNGLDYLFCVTPKLPVVETDDSISIREQRPLLSAFAVSQSYAQSLAK